jgi:murein DD-endopeptidase MepM/ murein hydrolase activator NlpD
MHTGLDLIAPEGTPVFSVLPGTVRLVAVDPSPLLQPIGTGASVAGRAPLPPLP